LRAGFFKSLSGYDHHMSASQAGQRNIRPYPPDFPILAAAGMRFTQGYGITFVKWIEEK